MVGPEKATLVLYLLGSLVTLTLGQISETGTGLGVQPTSRPPSACGVGQATCANGECIDRTSICDGDYDCSDGSDESGCRDNSICEPNEYQCNNKKCVLKTWRCDGDDDCGDRSDEQNCQPNPPGSPCRYYEWQCSSGADKQCIPKSFQCDGETDCQDQTDEIGCSSPEIVTSPPAVVEVDQSFTFIINCTAVGIPTPQVVWRLNWGHVPDKCSMSNRYLEDNQAFGELVCPQASPPDQGAYSCEAINSMGSCFAGSAGCGQPGQDAILVVKTGQSPCRPGFFNSLAVSPGQCLPCFCSGVSTSCTSTPLQLTTIGLDPRDELGLVGVQISPGAEPRVISRINSSPEYFSKGGMVVSAPRPSSLGVPAGSLAYFELPSSLNGGLLRSYGSSLRFSITYSSDGDPPRSYPLVMIVGGGEVLSYSPQQELVQDQVNRVEIRLWPGPLWTSSKGRGKVATREDFMLALANVKQVLVLAQLGGQGKVEVELSSFELETGIPEDQRVTGGQTIPWVEQCLCPAGYIGLSCSKCAPGYKRQGEACVRPVDRCPPGYYKDLEGECKVCPCPLTTPSNQFTSSCFLDMRDRKVTCRGCPEGFAGRRCEQCQPGYLGNPNQLGGSCRKGPQCSLQGSLAAAPNPATGRCYCKEGYSGPTCSVPKPSPGRCASDQYLSLEAAAPGCTNCFCMGVRDGRGGPTPCNPSNLYRGKLRAVFYDSSLNFQLVDSTLQEVVGEDELVVNRTTRELSYTGFRNIASLAYWKLPQQFLGNKLSSYGGFLEFTLRYIPRPGMEVASDGEALVELMGNDIRLAHYSDLVQQQAGHRYQVLMHEDAWQRVDTRQPANREHLLQALAGLEHIIVKAAHTEDTQQASISDLSLDQGQERGDERATAVEECRCPQGYRGLSCESCAPGYTRSDSGLYLGTCQPCQCGGKSATCDPVTGRCLDCRDFTTGPRCEACLSGYSRRPGSRGCTPDYGPEPISCPSCDPRGSLAATCPAQSPTYCPCRQFTEGRACDKCQPGTFGLSASNPGGCLPCYCSGVTDECSEARLFWSILSRNADSGGFRLTDKRQGVDRSGELQLLQDSTGMMELAYTPSGPSSVYYWALPKDFLGNKLGAYGGFLFVTQRFQAISQQGVPLQDSDIIMQGNGVSLHYSNQWDRVPGEQTKHGARLYPDEGWETLTGGVRNPATREDFLRVLSDIDVILIRASVVRDMQKTFLTRAKLDIAITQDNGNSLVRGAEECRCPQGYQGYSCEDCAPGYYRDLTDRSSTPLGRCISCPCSTEGSQGCSAERSEVRCICRPGWGGTYCDQPGSPSRDPVTVTVSEPRIQIVEVGGTVQFSCSVSQGASISQEIPLSIRWSKDGGALPWNRARDDGQGLLIITQVQTGDEGTYVCTATAGRFSVTQEAELKLSAEEIQGSRVVVSPSQVTAQMGEEVRVTCRGPPGYNTRWTKVGDSSTPRQEGGVLVLPRAGPQDSGTYQCTIVGVGQARVTITILSYLPPPSVRTEPEQQTVGQGERAEVRCLVTGGPVSSLVWSKVGEELGDRVEVAGDTLVIRGTAVSDRGMYLCTIQSQSGSARASAIVEVERREPPRIEIWPEETQTISTGSSVLFQCRAVAGIPSPTITWTRADGASMAANVEVLSGGALRINRATGREAGNYRCSASNVAGSVESVASLVIQEVPNVTLQPQGSVTLMAGQTLRITCSVTGDPPPTIRWTKLGPRTRQLPTTTPTLVVERVTKADEGTYACVASNVAGEMEERLQVLVGDSYPGEGYPGDNYPGETNTGGNYPGETSPGGNYPGDDYPGGNYPGGNSPGGNYPGGNYPGGGYPGENNPGSGGISMGGQDYVVGLGNNMELKADVVGNMAGNIRTIWRRKDGGQIPSRHVQRNGVLYIRAAARSDQGIYVCQGIDRRGTTLFNYEANLIIAASPRLELIPPSQTVRPGDSPQIECRVVQGDQPIDLQWSREGSPSLPTSVAQDGPRLQFRRIAVTDQGRYLCRASNAAGISEAVASVTVSDHYSAFDQSESEEGSGRYTNGPASDPLLEEQDAMGWEQVMQGWTVAPPKLDFPVDDVPQQLMLNGREGTSVDLPCRLAVGSDLAWDRLGGLGLPPQAKMMRNALRIPRVTVQDSGRYTCTSRGRTQYVDLRVERLNNQPEPQISVSASPSIPRAGEQLQLTCDVQGMGGRGYKVTWNRVGGEMESNVTVTGNSIRMESVSKQDEGLYRCKAVTRAGTFYSDFFLQVAPGYQGSV